jgi:membrane-associated phospholipid phosphatase
MGGNIGTQAMFHGPAASFGGVQWNTPLSGLVLKAELDGNDYSAEPFGVTLPASSPLNVAAVYRYTPQIDLSVGWERGNTVMFGLTMHTSLDKLDAPKLLDPVLPRVNVAAPAAVPVTAWATTGQDLGRFTGWTVREIRLQGDRVEVWADSDAAIIVQDRITRAATVLHRDMPANVKHFVLHLERYGVAMSEVDIDRAEWVVQHTQAVPPSFRLEAQHEAPGQTTVANAVGDTVYSSPDDLNNSLVFGPTYSQSLGGPDAFVLFQAGVGVAMEHKFTPSTWVNAEFNARVLDNYDLFHYDAPSNLPRVRTDVRQFVTTSTFTMPQLQFTHVSDLGGGNYVSAYAGMLETMYGGVGAEWLYRPWKSNLAFGVNMNHVRERDFSQNLAFQDYEVNTGHATVYWDTGWNDIQVNLSAGQYLAGDTGATLDVRRVFRNGVSVGGWFTRTNVSAEQFGEGSFDKGISVSIPFDLMLPKSAPGSANIAWHPLLRDGGAMLSRSFTLFDFTLHNDPRVWEASAKPADSWSDRFRSAQDQSYVLSEPSSWGDYAGNAASGLGHGIAAVPGSTWAWGAGLILASSLFDNKVDAWAQNHQDDNWNHIGNMANNLPYVLAAGTGLAFMGVAGEDAAKTATTSITAAAFTLGGNLLTKLAVGRSRPADEMGPGNFNGMTSSAAQSSFASNHVATAFALVTPFAQQSDQPWLYFVAAASGIGRIQSREHWFSDTVAGGLMGYAVGSICYEQQLGRKRAMQLSANLQQVEARWSF